MIPRIRQLNLAAVDFSHFVWSRVYWLGAGPIWCGQIKNTNGSLTRFDYRITSAIYEELKSHHDNCGDRRLRAEAPPKLAWWLDGMRKGMFCDTPVMPSYVCDALESSMKNGTYHKTQFADVLAFYGVPHSFARRAGHIIGLFHDSLTRRGIQKQYNDLLRCMSKMRAGSI